MNNEIELTVDEMILHQQKVLFSIGKKIIPHLTFEDILQPNDFPELENHPIFRYEEGTLAGMQMVQMAIRCIKNKH